MNLQPLAVPLHDIVVADDAFVREAADAFEILRGRAPGFFGMAGRASEAAIVIGDKLAQDGIGPLQIAGLGEAEFTGEAVLQDAPEAFDAAFGLGSLRGDEGNSELRQGAAELSGLLMTGELFVERPVIVIASEDATAIAIEGDRDTVAAQEALEQAKIAFRGFRREELRREDFAGSIVLHAQGGEQRAAALEPVVRRAVQLYEFTFASRAKAALTMSGRAAFARRADAVGSEQAAHGLTAEGEALLLHELLVEMVIVETGVARACQGEDAVAVGLWGTEATGAAAADVC